MVDESNELDAFLLSRLKDDKKNALELKFGVSYLPLSEIEPSRECLGLFPEELMRKHQMIPVVKDGTCLTLAMVDPNKLMSIDYIKTKFSGLQVKVTICTAEDFEQFMNTVYTTHEGSQQD